MNELDAIKARLDAATPGPWVVNECSPCTERGRLDVSVWDESGNLPIADWCDDDEFHRPDAELIANAPTDIARLLAAIEAVEKLAEEWRYKGEYGWGAWQEGQGPDPEGYLLDSASGELRAALSAALTPAPDVTRGAGEPNGAGVAPVDIDNIPDA